LKGIQENPFIKIEMTKSNAFLVMTFGEYIDIKQKGRAAQLYKPEVAVGKKRRKTLKKSQSYKESEEDKDIEDEEDYNYEDEDDDKEEIKQKQKKQKRGNKSYLEYLDTGNFKNMPNKTKKPNLLPDDDDKPTTPNKTKKPNLLPDSNDEPTELSASTLKVVKLTISPVKVKVEKMGNEVEVTKKELKNKKRMTLK